MGKSLLFPLAAFLVISAAGSARAQGYGVYEQGACAIGRGGASVASPCPDGSAIYFNPAGIVLTPGQTVSGGVTMIAPRGHFTDSTTNQVSDLNNRFYPVPSAYYKRNFKGDRASAGIGLFAPYGLTTDWPPGTSQGRFLGYKSLVHSIYIQPTVAAKLSNRVAIGGGVDITRTNLELRQRLDLASVPITGTPFTFGTLPVGRVPAGTDFADVDLTGSAWHAGYHLGVVVTASDKVSLGARYLSGQRVNITNGQATYTQISTGARLPIPLGPGIPACTPIDALVQPLFQPGGKLSSQAATTSVVLPDQFVAGVAVRVTPRAMVLADYQYVHWSMFDALVITQSNAGTQNIIEGYQNTSGVRVGVDYAVNPATSIRLGADFHGAAAPPQTVTPNLPEGSRQEFTGGVGHAFGAARIDAYYMYLRQPDRAGRTIGPPSGVAPTVDLNNGVYSFMSHLFGVTISVNF